MGRPSFFKFMVNDYYASQLRFPPAFVDKYGDKLPEKARIRANSGGTWIVQVESMEGEDSCFFTRGWSEFAQDFDLKFGEFVVFRFDVDNSTFEVDVYGVNGVEREFSDEV